MVVGYWQSVGDIDIRTILVTLRLINGYKTPGRTRVATGYCFVIFNIAGYY